MGRRGIRLGDYDYSYPGAYFVTVCAARRGLVFGCLQPEPGQYVPHRTQIASAEVIGVDQQRVEVVQVAAHLEEALAYRPDLLVAIEEGTAKRVEQGDDRQLDLGVSVVDCGIQKSGYPISSCQHVGAPDVSVDERWRVGVFDELIELLRQALHPKQILHRQSSGLVGDVRQVEQSMPPEELNPIIRRMIGLAQTTDERVPLVAVGGGSNVVQRCQEFSGVVLGLFREAAAPFDELIKRSVSEAW